MSGGLSYMNKTWWRCWINCLSPSSSHHSCTIEHCCITCHLIMKQVQQMHWKKSRWIIWTLTFPHESLSITATTITLLSADSKSCTYLIAFAVASLHPRVGRERWEPSASHDFLPHCQRCVIWNMKCQFRVIFKRKGCFVSFIWCLILFICEGCYVFCYSPFCLVFRFSVSYPLLSMTFLSLSLMAVLITVWAHCVS